MHTTTAAYTHCIAAYDSSSKSPLAYPVIYLAGNMGRRMNNSSHRVAITARCNFQHLKYKKVKCDTATGRPPKTLVAWLNTLGNVLSHTEEKDGKAVVKVSQL